MAKGSATTEKNLEAHDLYEIEALLSSGLTKLFEGTHPRERPVRVLREEGKLMLRADLHALDRYNVRVYVRENALCFRRRLLAVEIPLISLCARAIVRGRVLEVSLIERSVESSRALLLDIAKDVSSETWHAVVRVLKAAKSPTRSVFLTRGLNALAQLGEQAKEKVLAAASAAPTDYPVLVRALETPEALATLREGDPLGPARLRGIEGRQSLLKAAGGTFSAERAAKVLGISRQAVDKRRRSGKLLGLSLGRRGYAYPACQFAENGVLPGMEAVLETLQAHDPWMKLAFLVNKNTRLGDKAPMTLMCQAEIDSVLEAARLYGEHGAL